jgi:adenosylcobinamide-phosphate synthase
MRQRALVMAAAFGLDLVLGDPRGFPHPVRGIGALIENREKAVRRRYPKTRRGELAAGAELTAEVLAVTGLAAGGTLFLADRIHRRVRLAAETFMCYQMLASRSLFTESMKVYRALARRDREKARKAVSMIVGRDTECLTEEGIIRAAVETVAENTSDGVIAPLFYMALGGVPLMFLYKAVNTMDSMIGYQNEAYRYLGRCAARLDDAVNLIPSRLGAVLMVLCAGVLGMDPKGAWRIFVRDRYNHKSPNSAQTESACAGALGVELAGNAYYFGKLYEKPTIGDGLRKIEKEDIPRANGLMYGASLTMAFLCGAVLWLLPGRE